MTRSALIVADTELAQRPMLRRLARAADLIVAADGGADRALRAGLRVDWVVGDMDGIRPSTLRHLPPGRIVRDEGADTTDLEKAIRFLHGMGIRRAVITGAVGDRLDHTVGNLALLAEWGRKMELSIVDPFFVTTLVNEVVRFRAPQGTMVSLLAPAGAVGVSTRGLRFTLGDATLGFSTLGIHNEVARNPVEVRVREGVLFLMRSHKVTPHR